MSGLKSVFVPVPLLLSKCAVLTVVFQSTCFIPRVKTIIDTSKLNDSWKFLQG